MIGASEGVGVQDGDADDGVCAGDRNGEDVCDEGMLSDNDKGCEEDDAQRRGFELEGMN